MPIPEITADDAAWLDELKRTLGINPDLPVPYWNKPDGTLDREKTESEWRRLFKEESDGSVR